MHTAEPRKPLKNTTRRLSVAGLNINHSTPGALAACELDESAVHSHGICPNEVTPRNQNYVTEETFPMAKNEAIKAGRKKSRQSDSHVIQLARSLAEII